MHPILGHPRRLILYLVAWVPLAALLAYLLAVSSALQPEEAIAAAIPLCLLYAFVCLSAWYTCRMTPLDRSGAPALLSRHLAAAMVASGLWVLAANLMNRAFSTSFPGLKERVARSIPLLFGTGILLYLLSVAFYYVVLAVEASHEAKEREIQAGTLARDAELKALKARVNPHFLFNSLHSISALTSSDPAKAREMCILLAEFLRKTLGLGEKTAIPLEEEVALVKSYLLVEQVRFGARLRVKTAIAAEALDILVPPLLLQPLVENAVSHGIANLTEGGSIFLGAEHRDESLSIIVENNFDPQAPTKRKNGMGLANVRQRLQTRYGTLANMSVRTEGNCFRVTLAFPAERRGEPA